MSMFQRIKEWVFRQVQKRHVRQTVVFPNYAKVNKVLVLFESDMQECNDEVKQWVKTLQAEGKQVTAWGYAHKKQIASAVLRDYRIIGQNDCNSLGRPNAQALQDLGQEHFDLLIDLNTHHLLPLRYLSVYANADFRAGALNPNNPKQPYLHDFMIDLQGNCEPAFLFQQIMHYLRSIQPG